MLGVVVVIYVMLSYPGYWILWSETHPVLSTLAMKFVCIWPEQLALGGWPHFSLDECVLCYWSKHIIMVKSSVVLFHYMFEKDPGVCLWPLSWKVCPQISWV